MSSLRFPTRLSLEDVEKRPSMPSILELPALASAAAAEGTMQKPAISKRTVSSPVSVPSIPKTKAMGGRKLLTNIITETGQGTSIPVPLIRTVTPKNEESQPPTTAKPNVSSATSTSVMSMPITKVVTGCKPASANQTSLPNQKVSNPSISNSTVPTPMLYVGITLERSKTVNSWGLVFTKDKANHALIVRVIPRNKAVEGPTVKWCRITNARPRNMPSVVYRTMPTSIIPLDQYESSIAQNFPPPCVDERLQNAGLLVPHLTPGDAIISINGLPVGAFPTIGKFASYIRQNCQRKMVIVALRHERVWKAALVQMSQRKSQEQQDVGGGLLDNQATTDRISMAIQTTWKHVLNYGRNSHHQVKRKATSHPTTVKRPKIAYTNSSFRDGDGKPILYCDNYDSDPDEGKRIQGFVNNEIESSFDQWLRKRKATWREGRPKKYISQPINNEINGEEEVITVQHEFWLASGYESFDQWLSASKTKWTRSYSRHKERRNAFQSECQREVHFPMVTPAIENHILLNQFENWLGVRKKQWRLEQRKRQRHRVEIMPSISAEDDDAAMGDSSDDPNPCAPTNSNQTTMCIDEILEDQERRTTTETTRQPMDISWVFDSQLGAPDDIIVTLMEFLCPSDHGNLLCLSYTTNAIFKQRSDMWRTLCPTHWILPRRPRKSWCVMYITKIRAEEEAARKRSDDLLLKAHNLIEKADQFTKLEKLIKKAEKGFFSVNYTSGVVLERNSLLNLAVIDKRHKITKWLIEDKGADIESCDRGQFTPLLNAAFNGDKHIVRYLLGRGSDRTKVGYNHSSQGLAPATFEGLSAEGWARKQGHGEVAELIRLGL